VTVRVVEVAPQPTLVVRATTTWAAFGEEWPRLLDRVWAVLRSAEPPVAHGQNVMLYLDGAPTVEVGVEVPAGPPGLSGGDAGVVASTLPGGRVAEAVHVGSPAGIGATHDAVVAWCAGQGLATTGVRWEVYGDWQEDEARFETLVRWLLADG
jgi:effector-binding domain-containing protein